MNDAKHPEDERQEREDRLSRMNRASVRITESLDLESVLRGVVDGACSLTGARHGGVTVIDEEGDLQSFVTSGLTPEEHGLVVALPGGLAFFEHMSALPEPLRLSDFSAYTRESGLPEIAPPLGPVGAFLTAPIHHLGRRVGNIYLSGAEDGAGFTADDEGVLMLFASQAALAIANARRYREEQRARADLETLVNTSPVGVGVFDAATGALVSLNREARRIVDGLRDPDQSMEQLLEVLTFRRADGREFSLQEVPLTRVLTSGETVRAEEIVIQVPDGRRVTTIINATPIRSEDGAVTSLVVTAQDLAPLKELGRQRAEFLGLVSQELLAPLTSIKGSAAAVLEDLSRLDLAGARQLFSIIEWQADRMRGLIADLAEVARIEAGTLFLIPESTDLASLVDQARAAFLEGGTGNPLEVDLPPDLPRVAADRQRVLRVLDHLLANAAAGSPEGSAITVSARREEAHVAVCVADQGGGIPSQPLPLLFQRLSRREGGGRGGGDTLGLAVCRGIVEAHGGRIQAESDGPGLGSRLIFTLPVAEEAAPGRPGPLAAGDRRAAPGQGRVLVVDDDPQVLWHVRGALSEAGYAPVVTWDPEEVERLLVVERPHVVLLDPALPASAGMGLLERVLQLTDAPVVLLAGPDASWDGDVAPAFEAGADDYLVKPFSPTELVARVGATLRRREAPEREAYRERFQFGALSIDFSRRRVTVEEREIGLTETEYRLLAELALNAGQALSREHLMRRVWSTRAYADAGVVRAYVKRLRRKLGESAANPIYIFNEPRVGYRLGPAREDRDG
ncbi:MAG: winged helix-turn-helix domain-containing protein [Chloroflexi bacterium]|nr:winged helix-turn-helix domain-containing protein [Chloroflexota bacterium]